MEPLQQGELDFFYGICSAINAVRLALADTDAALSRANCSELFCHVAKFVARKGALEALIWGLALRRRLAVAKLIVEVRTGQDLSFLLNVLTIDSGPRLMTPMAGFGSSLATGKPVLAYLAEDPDHYTVIAGITPTTLHLFDSAGMKLIRRWHISLSADSRILWPPGLWLE